MQPIMIKSIKGILVYELINTNKYNKGHLRDFYKQLEQSDFVGTKNELASKIADSIMNKIDAEVSQLLKSEPPKDDVRRSSVSFLVEKMLASLWIKNWPISNRNLTQINQILNSDYTEPYHSMSRQQRPNQEIIENIWSQSLGTFTECVCPKPPTNLEEQKRTEKCYRCGQMCHIDCYWAREQKQQVFECPFCYLRYCYPQKEVKQVIFAGYLPILKKQKVEYRINFSLDPGFKTEKTYLEARCVKFNQKNRFELSWPDSGSFSLGKMKLNDFKPLQNNSPLKRRPDEPIKMDKTRLQIQNQVVIQEKNISEAIYRINKKSCHLVMILMIQDIPKQSVFAKLEKKVLTTNQSKEVIREYLDHQSQDIMIEKLSISLKCQFYYSRIKIPVRSKLCSTHYQPFDLMNFISSSIQAKTSSKKWKCPICDKRAYDLVVDNYILELMNKDKKADTITFKSDAEPLIYQEQIDSDESESQKQPDPIDNNCIDLESTPEQNVPKAPEVRQEPRSKPFEFLFRGDNKKSNKPVQSVNIDEEQIFNNIHKFLNHSGSLFDESNKVSKMKKLNNGEEKFIQVPNKLPQITGPPNPPPPPPSKNVIPNPIDVVEIISSDDEIPAVPEVRRSTQDKNKSKVHNNRKQDLQLKRKTHQQKQFQDNIQISERIEEFNRAKEKKDTSKKSFIPDEVDVVIIDSDHEMEEQRADTFDLRKQMKQLENMRKGLEKLGKPNITEQDTEIVESIFKRFAMKEV